MKSAAAVWFVYLIRCRDGSLYTGITTDVDRRLGEHASGGRRAARYLKGRGPLQLIYSRAVGSRSQAAKEEYRIKQLSKTDKEALVALDSYTCQSPATVEI